MKQEFGTPYTDSFSSQELLNKSKNLLGNLFCVNENEYNQNPLEYEGVIDLLEIVKFGKDKFPYLLSLKFDNKILTKVELWNDPHYQDLDGVSSAFVGTMYNLPNLELLARKPQILKESFNSLLTQPPLAGEIDQVICIAGSCYSVLNIGKARKSVFENYLLTPLFSVSS